MATSAPCRFCGRDVTYIDGRYIDLNATGDDRIWRETCDKHDTTTAEHDVAAATSFTVVAPGATLSNEGFLLSHNGAEWSGTYGVVLRAALDDFLSDGLPTACVLHVEQNNQLVEVDGDFVSRDDRVLHFADEAAVYLNDIISIAVP